MPELIQNGQIVQDDWTFVTLADDQTAASVELPPGRLVVPLTVWFARRDELAGRPDATLGVWLAPDDDPAEIARDLSHFAVIAVHFPKFADGRGYSIATLLRTRFGYRGELRAFGDVLRDQFNYLVRCGFDALQPADGRYSREQLQAAVASIGDFSQPYQHSAAVASPLFQRTERGATV